MATTEELIKQANELYIEKNHQGVIDLLPDAVLEECKSDELYALKAGAYNELNEYKLCKQMAEKALVLNAKNASAYYNIGNVYYRKGQYEMAVIEYKKAISNDRTQKNTYNNLGNAYYKLNEYNNAIDAYYEAIEIDSKYLFAYIGLGSVYLKLKDYEKAIDTYNYAKEIDPKYIYVYIELANIYIELQQYEKAVEEYKEAIKIDPKFSSAYNGLGIVYYNLQKHQEAIEISNEGLKINEKDAALYNNLGNSYRALKQYNKAIGAYNQSIVINPKDAFSHNGLGNTYRGLQENEKAIEAYTEAIKIDPNFAASYYNRALIYFDLEQYKEALSDYQNYISLGEGQPFYYISFAKSQISEINKLIGDTSYSDINTLVNKIKSLLLYKEDCITHYTSLTVAKALILDKSKLRLSEGAYLNDTSEGRELFKYLHLSVTPVDGHDTVAALFTKKPFIGSFVAESKHDDLTLWRMYGKEAKEEARGCAITMHREKLIKKITASLSGYKKEDAYKAESKLIFYRVAYRKQDDKKPFTIPSGKPEDDDLLNECMKDLQKKVKDFEEKRAGNTTDKQKLLELLNEIAYLFKSYEYQYEHEIRLVLKGTGIDKVVDMAFTPPKVYIELVNIRPVLKKITLGPKVEKSDEWASALFYSLDKEGLSPDILISHLPFK